MLQRDLTQSYQAIQQVLMTKSRSTTRTKRALLSFLSPVFHSIFGLATTKDMETIQQNLEILLENQRRVSNNTESLRKSFIEQGRITSQCAQNQGVVT